MTNDVEPMQNRYSSRLFQCHRVASLWAVYGFLLVLVSIHPRLAVAETIVILGDSISAGYGVPASSAWVKQLQNELEPTHTIVNASISGETTEGGKARIAGILERHKPDVMFIELGGNDGLRGFRLDIIEANLRHMIEQSQASGANVILAGMRIPPNYGPRYTEGFFALYQKLSDEYGTALIPFFLEGIATTPELMQQDGIHPNEQAQRLLLEHARPAIMTLIDSLQ